MSLSGMSVADRYWSSIWRPGVQGLLVFVALGVIGFLIWNVHPASTLQNALGIGWREWYDSTFYSTLDFLMEPAIRCVLALLAGFLFPRGFYLWGLAIAIHTPLTHVLTTNRMIESGIEPYLGGTVGMLNYLLIDSMLTAAMIVIYTCCAGVGALARYLPRRNRRTN